MNSSCIRGQSGESILREVDNHAKLMIVDDRFLTVGSCNINDRGFEFEGELNIAVVDPQLVNAARLAIFKEHLANDVRLNGELTNDLQIWYEHAKENERFAKGKTASPISHVFPFKPERDQLIFTNEDVF